MSISRHQREAEALAKRLRARNSSSSKRAGKLAVATARRGLQGRATKGAGSWKKTGRTVGTLLKIHKGGRAGAPYALKQKGARQLATNMFFDNLNALNKEFEIDQAMHPRVNNLFKHLSLSRPEGHPLTPTQWQKFAALFLKKIDAEGNQFILIEHANTKNNHVHLVFSRAKPDGKLSSDSQNFWRWRAVVRDVETELGLQVEGQPAERPAAPSDRAVSAQRRALRRGTSPEVWIDPALVERALEGASTPDDFARALARAGIEVQAARQADGAARGLLLRRKGAAEFLAGTSIDRNFSLPKIQARIEKNRLALLQKRERAGQFELNTRRPLNRPGASEQVQIHQHPKER